MGKYFHNENFDLHPQDPDYNSDYDLDEDYERYLETLAEKEDRDRGN